MCESTKSHKYMCINIILKKSNILPDSPCLQKLWPTKLLWPHVAELAITIFQMTEGINLDLESYT